MTKRTRTATQPIPAEIREPIAAMVWDLAEFGYAMKPSQRLDRFFDEYGSERGPHRKLWVRRDALAFQFLRLTGTRFCEFSRAMQQDVVGDRVMILGAKGSENREIQLEADAPFVPLLSRWYRDVAAFATRGALWADAINRSQWLIPSNSGNRLSNDRFNRFLSAVGAMFDIHITAHSLRDTAAAEIYESTKDIRRVQRFLGHRSIRSTEVYLSKVMAEVASVPSYHRPRLAATN